MIRRRKPVVILLSAEELAVLERIAVEQESTVARVAQGVFRAGLGMTGPNDPPRSSAPIEGQP